MAVFVIIWLVCAGVGYVIGNNKGRPALGFVLGLLLGIIGLIIIACMHATPEAEARRNQQVYAASQAMGGMPAGVPAAVPAGGAQPLRPCPYCAEFIQPAARVCRFCNHEVDPIPVPTAKPAEGWYPDPSSRHPDRYWNGDAWTEWVRDRPGGNRESDPQPWTASWN